MSSKCLAGEPKKFCAKKRFAGRWSYKKSGERKNSGDKSSVPATDGGGERAVARAKKRSQKPFH